ncbi:uncharacterized protein PV07_08879 [Cladophialophora immunda]|uniref:Heterokaryon incompatibility domain-containing protein n=1 Tax=Cladophialophora immunda TaxID=569365 RepID=A0A0D2CQ41_9EURO|nr:uncharacterized protein PV07_08879 [Cladophialophora immunda]KIW25724.1 hypothetical protein PV07_08879 [Cladophialophora immunda]
MSSSSLGRLRPVVAVAVWSFCFPLLHLSFSLFGLIRRRFLEQGFRLQLTPKNYVYTPLETADHIRVIELMPADSEDDEVCCRLHHMNQLQPSYSYTALSYVWGDDSEELKVTISCNGRQARITPNLHSAFVRLRRSNSSRFLWADALCINQAPTAKDVAEKEQQVRTMDRTFSKAEQVIIDLGSSAAPEVLSILDRFHSIPQEVWEEARSVARNNSLKSCLQVLAAFGLPDVRDAFWPEFSRFMQRPWFTRVWVIQEYTLACQSAFVIGKEMRPGTYLPCGIMRALSYAMWLYHFDRRAPSEQMPSQEFASVLWDLTVPHTAVQLIQEARDNQHQRLPLSTLLWRTRQCHAKKARDKVYAILALVDDARVRDQIPIDYQSEEIHPVGLQVARYLIEAGRGPYVLYNCLGVQSAAESWEVLLTRSNQDAFSDLYDPSDETVRTLYHASKDTQFMWAWKPSHEDSVPTMMQDPDRVSSIFVRGCIVDEITSRGPALPYQGTISHADVSAQSHWLPDSWEWMQSVQHLQGLPLNEFTLQCWQTAIADLIVPSEGEGRGYVRCGNVKMTPLCLEAIDNAARHASAERRGSLRDFRPTMPVDAVFQTYCYMLSESFRYSFGRRLALTEKMCLTCCVPRETEDADLVCILLGCPTPFVLRRVQNHYRIVGCCYVHGFMDGEALKASFWKEEDLEIR